MTTFADEIAVKAMDIEQDRILKPIAEAIESGLSKIPGEPGLVEEELAPIERALGKDVPLPAFDAPTEGMARVPKPGGGTMEVPITQSNVDAQGNLIDAGDRFINDLDSKLQELRKQKIVKTPAFNFQLDSEGNLRLPKNPRSKATQTLFKQISEDPQFTAEEKEHLLSSFSPKTLQIVQAQELDAIIPAPDFGPVPGEVKLQPLATDLTAEELGLRDTGTKSIQEGLQEGIDDPNTSISQKSELRRMLTRLQMGEDPEAIFLELQQQGLEEFAGLKPVPKVGAVGQPLSAGIVGDAGIADTAGVLSESELKSSGILRTMDESLPIRDDIDQSIFDEQPGDFVPSRTEISGSGELTEAKGPFVLERKSPAGESPVPEEASEAEQSTLMKAVDKIKSGSIAEGFEDIKGSSLYKGTLSFLRSDLIKTALVAGGVSATGIAIYDKLLEEDNQNDLNLIPKDLEGLNATLKKYGEIYALSQKVGKAKQQALNRFNQPGFDSVRRRDNERELKKLEQADKNIKANLKEMNRKVENTVRILKNRDAENDRDIRREKAIKKAKENTDKRLGERELKNLQRRILQPVVAKDVAPKIPISINIKNSPKNTSENKFDPRMIQTQM